MPPAAASSMLWMCRSTFSMTTIASSTTMPVARTMASVSVLIEKSRRCTNANAPTRDTGSVSAGMSVARQLWRNRNITSTTRRDRDSQCLDDFANRFLNDRRRVEGDAVLEARWNDRPRRVISSVTPRWISSALAVGRASTRSQRPRFPGSATATSSSPRPAPRRRRLQVERACHPAPT